MALRAAAGGDLASLPALPPRQGQEPISIDRFIAELSAFSSPGVFNPWLDVDRVNDLDAKAPAVRRDQLRRYLAGRAGRAKLLLVAEAAGYQGAKFSGIAMTSERQLLAAPETGGEFFDGPKRRTSRPAVQPAGFTEPTATIVWGRLLAAGLRGRDWVNWNAFAWHPHRPGEALSNRTPTPRELEAGAPALERFLALFPGAKVIAVGRKSSATLAALGVDVAAEVRHPANGGASAFGAGVATYLASLPVRGT